MSFSDLKWKLILSWEIIKQLLTQLGNSGEKKHLISLGSFHFIEWCLPIPTHPSSLIPVECKCMEKIHINYLHGFVFSRILSDVFIYTGNINYACAPSASIHNKSQIQQLHLHHWWWIGSCTSLDKVIFYLCMTWVLFRWPKKKKKSSLTTSIVVTNASPVHPKGFTRWYLTLAPDQLSN